MGKQHRHEPQGFLGGVSCTLSFQRNIHCRRCAMMAIGDVQGLDIPKTSLNASDTGGILQSEYLVPGAIAVDLTLRL
jgi:hypothetical protein